MEKTIKNGDRILINKFRYGPRLPSSPKEIPFLNIILCLSTKYAQALDSGSWNYARLLTLSKINYNHIIVFNYPKNPNIILIKRCYALPGDTLSVSNKTILINSRHESFQGIRNREQKNFEDHKTVLIPKDAHFSCDLKNFGPLIIPFIDYTIKLTNSNYVLYGDIINHFENCRITFLDNSFLINGEKEYFYTFKNNYYFALGDNPDSSIDSRHWGLIPEKFIIGKASFILFSRDRSELIFQRFLKKIK